MTDAAGLTGSLGRYEKIISAALANVPEFVPESESAGTIQVERGVVFARAVSGDDAPGVVTPLIELSTATLRDMAVLDRAGHRRGEYRPLMVYACLRAMGIYRQRLPAAEFPRWDWALLSWCEALEQRLKFLPISDKTNPASTGTIVAEAAWSALALHVAGTLFARNTWRDLSAESFARIVRARQETGARFLHATSSDNPETHWYHELVILHALASYAADSHDRASSDAFLAATDFHLAQTQPDHATNQPLALFAFLSNPNTHPVADALLHSSGILSGSRALPSGISLILLADALYCLRLYSK